MLCGLQDRLSPSGCSEIIKNTTLIRPIGPIPLLVFSDLPKSNPRTAPEERHLTFTRIHKYLIIKFESVTIIIKAFSNHGNLILPIIDQVMLRSKRGRQNLYRNRIRFHRNIHLWKSFSTKTQKRLGHIYVIQIIANVLVGIEPKYIPVSKTDWRILKSKHSSRWITNESKNWFLDKFECKIGFEFWHLCLFEILQLAIHVVKIHLESKRTSSRITFSG